MLHVYHILKALLIIIILTYETHLILVIEFRFINLQRSTGSIRHITPLIWCRLVINPSKRSVVSSPRRLRRLQRLIATHLRPVSIGVLVAPGSNLRDTRPVIRHSIQCILVLDIYNKGTTSEITVRREAPTVLVAKCRYMVQLRGCCRHRPLSILDAIFHSSLTLIKASWAIGAFDTAAAISSAPTTKSYNSIPTTTHAGSVIVVAIAILAHLMTILKLNL